MVLAVEAEDASFESLADSGRFKALDVKLSAALTDLCTGELAFKVTNATEAEADKSRLIKGRQVLFMIYEWFNLCQEAGALYDAVDLFNVKLKPGASVKELENFLDRWDHTVFGLKKPIEEDQKREFLYEQMVNCPSMNQDIAYYDRLTSEDPAYEKDHTYDFFAPKG